MDNQITNLQNLDFINSFRNALGQTFLIFSKIKDKSQLKIISDESLERIRRIYNRLNLYKHDIPRIYFFGEFKAGKSSLINSIIKRKVCPVDIFEMTAWTTKICGSKEDYCKVIYKNLNEEFIASDEMITKLENRVFDNTFLNNIELIEFGLNDFNANYILVDNPGFGGLSLDNEKKLIDMIHEADLVAFTIDSESIGSLKEFGLINEFNKKGINFIIIISKIDLVSNKGDLDEIINYIVNDYSINSDKIFPISAYTGEGLDRLKHFFYNFSLNFKNTDRLQMEYGYLKIIAELFIQELDNLIEKIQEIKSKVNEFNDIVDEFATTFDKDIVFTIREKIKSTLFINRNNIKNEIANLLIRNKGKISEEEIRNIFIKNIPNIENFEFEIYKNLVMYIREEVKNKWINNFNDIILKSSMLLKDFLPMELEISENIIRFGSYEIDLQKPFMETLSAGFKSSLGVAGVLSAYAAWFGPAAAYVTLPMALSAFLLPVTIIGTGISAIFAYNKRKKIIEQGMHAYAEEIINQIEDNFYKNILPFLKEESSKFNQHFASVLKEKFYQDNMLGFDSDINLDKIKNLKIELKRFIL